MSNAICAISIVTYNSKHIFDVLDNLKKEFAEDERFRFVIFDNNSNEDYIKHLKEYEDFADINFYHENNGFGFGHNYNLLNADEKYFVIFNPDIILTKETLTKMLDQMEQDKTISLLVPKVINTDGTTQYLIRNRVSVLDYALRFIPFKFVKNIFSKRLASYECRTLPDDRNVDIRIGSGCFMCIRAEIYKEIKGFDDRYFMYFEDYDLCLELEKRKKRVVYTPLSIVTHYYERGAHKSSKLFRIFMKSMYKFFDKWGWKFY
ncbi:glycosyl transferase family 2 [Bacillus canaveralius]|uniref:Glycosyl transferase family 2 n=1 Tax=Bacillus canaveralius TaxID=1403243 RepID=A0A2N5GML2_9BACI|nr:glycosyltransferase family 2 protein [Bacillus canaveralius]PLR83139.1 glycosyl transferase family 2 [Bacillus canaveralius]PLR94057.1 glycosyl transferase family 2 [Bacillus canaveralius]RSK54142.1 glycosyltransferase family 2 protein [Bacillus canaveralius]